MLKTRPIDLAKTDVQGSVLRFTYGGGSTPGSTRLVYVLGYVGVLRTLQCYDFGREDVRNFNPKFTSNTELVEVNKIGTAILPLDLRTVIEAYENDGKNVFHDEKNGQLVIFDVPASTKYAASYNAATKTLGVAGPNGTLSLAFGGHGFALNKRVTPTGEDIVKAFANLG